MLMVGAPCSSSCLGLFGPHLEDEWAHGLRLNSLHSGALIWSSGYPLGQILGSPKKS